MTEKEIAIRDVITKRMDILGKIISKRTGEDKAYYEGKRDGLLSVYSLLSETLECIKIELE